MILALISGLALAGAGFVLLGRALVMPRARATQTLRVIEGYGFAASASHGVSSEPTRRSLMHVLAGRFGTLLGDRFGGAVEDELRKHLLAAGLYKTHPRDFRGYRLLAAIGVGAFMWWLTAVGGRPAILTIVFAALGAGVGWTLPLFYLKRRAARRMAEVDHNLPELIDLLVVTVEAGLGFNGSLQMAAERLEGPLGDELRLALQEQRMGLAPQETLRNMLDRCDTPMMRSFVRSTLQGEALGVSIGTILRNLASEMRIRRRQSAEERAQKAPTKLLFPLIFLIFPGMFVVILGPAGFAVLDAF